MRARPFRLLAAAHLEHVRRVLDDAIAQWSAAWGIGSGEVATSVEAAFAVRAGVHEGHGWRQQWSGAAGTAWCDWEAETPAAVKQLVFPGDGGYAPRSAPDTLAQAGAALAFDDLLTALRRACGTSTTVALLRAPDADAVGYASGAVSAVVSLGRARMRLILDDACVRAMLGVGPGAVAALPALGKVALATTLASTPVALTVRAGDVELGAGTLLSIGVGDVIASPLRLDAPLSLALPGGREVCKGFIGRRGHHLAVEIAAQSH